MTRNQYEQHKQRLEDQLRTGIQLLESAYQAQVRALDLVWMLQAETGATVASPAPALPSAQQEAPSSPSRPRRRSVGDLEADIRAVLPDLPETFTRREICEAIGYEPDRGSLYRVLQELVQEGSTRLESRGAGQIPAAYRKTGARDAAASG